MLQNLQNLAKFQKCHLDNLVDFEKIKMLQNAYLLAKIGADTAENERSFAEYLPEIANCPTAPGGRRGTPGRSDGGPKIGKKFRQIFGEMSLVFGCIGADLCKKIRVLQHSSKSTKLFS